MAQPEFNSTIYPMKSATDASGASTTAKPSRDDGANAGQDSPTGAATVRYSVPPAYFNEALEDAEQLLKYAAENGVGVDADTREYVLKARSASEAGWSDETAANLLVALTKLAALLRPACAEGLKAYSDPGTRRTLRIYWTVALCLAFIIVPFSAASFVSSAISTAIRTDIATANDLVVKLRAEVGTANAPTAGNSEQPQLPKGLNEADVTAQLQLYASTIRAIDARSRQLNRFVFQGVRDPFAKLRWSPKLDQPLSAEEQKFPGETQNEANQIQLKGMFQLTVGLPNMPKDLDKLTDTYQDVRTFAQDTLDLVSVSYGAFTTCLLPVLYALLGTCAYLLRTFEQQMAARTFMPSGANFARFLIAGIGGAVVGLFNNFTITQGASIPPLALAFLVGYAVDVFFSFLEGLLQTFTKAKGNTPTPTTS